MNHLKWKLEVMLSVDPSWVEDGFDATKRIEHIEEAIAGLLPYAYGHEFKVKAKVVSAPDKTEIKKLQGYEQ